MKQNFKNINEELERIKTLMFETDNFIKNGTPLNEQTAPADDTSKEKTDFKTVRSSFKLAKISDLNTILRGGASKFDTYKVKGTGVMNLFDATGKMTPEGIELMKKSGLTLPAGQIIMRIGKVDDPNTDKVFFQVVPTKEISVVTKSGDIKNLDPKELENLPTVQDLKPTVAPAPVQKPSETTTFVEDKSLIGKKIEDLAKQFNLKITDITEKFKEAGYTASPFYKKNEDTKTVYGVDKDGIIKSIFKRLKGEKVEAVAESFNMDIIFTNPLLFESVISEQETTPDYYIKTDAAGKETKMNNKFTQVVDGTWKGGGGTTGGATGGGESKPSTDPWANYPCITSNSAIKKVNDPKMGIVYQDAANTYFSNGRYYNFKTKKKGDYSCEGNKIVASSGEGETKKTTKATVVSDADLLGDTGLLRQYFQQVADIGFAGSNLWDSLGINFPNMISGRRTGVKGVVDALDGDVSSEDLGYVLTVIKSLSNKVYYDEEFEIYENATKRFVELYSEDEGGDDLIEDVKNADKNWLGMTKIGQVTKKAGYDKLKNTIVNTIQKQLNAPLPSEFEKEGTT